MTENENVIDASTVGESESAAQSTAAESKTATEDKKTTCKTGNGAMWLAIILLIAVSIGGIVILYKRLDMVENRLFANLKTVEASNSPKVTDSESDSRLVAKIVALENKDQDFSKKIEKILATQKNFISIEQSANKESKRLNDLKTDFATFKENLATVPQSLELESKKLNLLRDDFSSLEKKLKALQEEQAKAKAKNLGLLKARPVIKTGIRQAEILGNLKQAALLFQEAAVILRDAKDPRNALAEQKLVQISQNLQKAYIPDVMQINSIFDDLLPKVNQLTFLGGKIAAKKPKKASKADDLSASGVVNTIWSDVRSLVKISKDESEYKAVTSNEARQSYRAILRLKLEQARFMAHTSNQAEYENSINAARMLTEKFFDNTNSKVTNFTKSLEEAAKVKVTTEDVTDQLQIAREIIK